MIGEQGLNAPPAQVDPVGTTVAGVCGMSTTTAVGKEHVRGSATSVSPVFLTGDPFLLPGT